MLLRRAIGTAGVVGVLLVNRQLACAAAPAVSRPDTTTEGTTDMQNASTRVVDLELYQYEPCPFCNKVCPHVGRQLERTGICPVDAVFNDSYDSRSHSLVPVKHSQFLLGSCGFCFSYYLSLLLSLFSLSRFYNFSTCFGAYGQVRAYFDYSKVPYRVVEVNPLFKSELKFSDYKKVPGTALHNHLTSRLGTCYW